MYNIDVFVLFRFDLKMPSKFICILHITFCDKQLCGRCLVNMTPVVKVVIHCVLHYYKRNKLAIITNDA